MKNSLYLSVLALSLASCTGCGGGGGSKGGAKKDNSGLSSQYSEFCEKSWEIDGYFKHQLGMTKIWKETDFSTDPVETTFQGGDTYLEKDTVYGRFWRLSPSIADLKKENATRSPSAYSVKADYCQALALVEDKLPANWEIKKIPEAKNPQPLDDEQNGVDKGGYREELSSLDSIEINGKKFGPIVVKKYFDGAALKEENWEWKTRVAYSYLGREASLMIPVKFITYGDDSEKVLRVTELVELEAPADY